MLKTRLLSVWLLTELLTLASGLAFYPVVERKASSPVKNALGKKSGVSVAVEVVSHADAVAPIDEGEVLGGGRRTVALTSDERLAKLSAELRGGREGALASAIFAKDVDAVAVLAKEQATAKGDFPGPCPVVFSGDATDAEAAVASGAAGVVLTADDLEVGKAIDAEVVWRVGTAAEVDAIVSDDGAPEATFMVDGGADATALLDALPAKAVGMVALDAMQDDDGECVEGRALVSGGRKAIVVRGACVGDAEDLPYSKYVVKALTSKRSSAFAIDGHTGSTNGHFGGMRATNARPEDGWLRKQ